MVSNYKKIKIILSKKAQEVFEYLNKESINSKIELSILKSIKQKAELIKQNPHYGNPISKKLIPIKYKNKYGVTNLFRVELPNYWRILYTLTEGETKIEIIAFVLGIMSHKKYNKLFGYK
jgi:hypothetical protein